MRLASFVVPAERQVRVGIVSHDGARVVDLTAIGVDDMFAAVARIHDLRRVAAHLVHSPGSIAYAADQIRLVAPLPFARSAWGSLGTASDSAPAGGRLLPLASAPPSVRLDYLDPEPILGPLDNIPAPGPSGAGAELAFGVAGVIGGAPLRGSGESRGTEVVGFAPVLRWAGRTAMGPWLVTADEIPPAGDASDLPPAITLAVGGAVRYRGSWSDEAFAVGPVRAVAAGVTLRAGDVLCAVRRTGPPAPGNDIVLNAEWLGALSVRAASAAIDPVATPAATAE